MYDIHLNEPSEYMFDSMSVYYGATILYGLDSYVCDDDAVLIGNTIYRRRTNGQATAEEKEFSSGLLNCLSNCC